MNKVCKNCGNFIQYYVYTLFFYEKACGYCRKHCQIRQISETCESYVQKPRTVITVGLIDGAIEVVKDLIKMYEN